MPSYTHDANNGKPALEKTFYHTSYGTVELTAKSGKLTMSLQEAILQQALIFVEKRKKKCRLSSFNLSRSSAASTEDLEVRLSSAPSMQS